MAPIVYPVGIGALALLAYYMKSKREKAASGQAQGGSTVHGEMTPERQEVYELAMNKLASPADLNTLADAFGAEGLPAHAAALRQRAALRALPEAQKAARKEAYRKALKSKNKKAVIGVANAFGAEGCPGAQAAILKYAEGLDGEES